MGRLRNVEKTVLVQVQIPESTYRDIELYHLRHGRINPRTKKRRPLTDTIRRVIIEGIFRLSGEREVVMDIREFGNDWGEDEEIIGNGISQ